jgi:hypothetical protein
VCTHWVCVPLLIVLGSGHPKVGWLDCAGRALTRWPGGSVRRPWHVACVCAREQAVVGGRVPPFVRFPLVSVERSACRPDRGPLGLPRPPKDNTPERRKEVLLGRVLGARAGGAEEWGGWRSGWPVRGGVVGCVQ